MRNAIFLIASLFVFFLSSSCNKDEGKGGKHSIKGTVTARKYNLSTHTYTSTSYAAEEEDVYLIYGDDPTYGDKQKTNYDGSFEFKYLQKGKYKVYAYSDDSTGSSASGKVAVVKELTIGSEKITTVPDITILK
jgi:hypothetical protein